MAEGKLEGDAEGEGEGAGEGEGVGSSDGAEVVGTSVGAEVGIAVGTDVLPHQTSARTVTAPRVVALIASSSGDDDDDDDDDDDGDGAFLYAIRAYDERYPISSSMLAPVKCCIDLMLSSLNLFEASSFAKSTIRVPLGMSVLSERCCTSLASAVELLKVL